MIKYLTATLLLCLIVTDADACFGKLRQRIQERRQGAQGQQSCQPQSPDPAQAQATYGYGQPTYGQPVPVTSQPPSAGQFRSPVGHTHTCPHCGLTWDHQANPGHNCPRCGTPQYVADPAPRMVPVGPATRPLPPAAPPTYYQLPGAPVRGGCPNGQCPVVIPPGARFQSSAPLGGTSCGCTPERNCGSPSCPVAGGRGGCPCVVSNAPVAVVSNAPDTQTQLVAGR